MFMQMKRGQATASLKAVIDCKLLTLNALGQHLSSLETRNFQRKQTNLTIEG